LQRLTLTNPLGHGASALVYLGQNESSGKQYAFKRFLLDTITNDNLNVIEV
jgi:serine/threonine protein kinase